MDVGALSLQQLRYLDAVADGETFVDAADDLFISQSALSQGLARLEKLAGVPLFEPDGRRRRLTEAGEELAAAARRILAEAERAAAALEERAEGEGGRLRLAMIDAAALYLFPQSVPRFRHSRPAVDVRITVSGSDECLERLAAFEDDLAIVVGPAKRFDVRSLTTERFSIYGPTPDPPPDADWLLYPTDSHTRALIDTGLAAAGILPRVVGESGNPDVLRQLAVLNRAWTVLPAAVAGSGPAESLVKGADVMVRPIVAARRRSAPPSPLVDAYLEQLARV